MSGIRLEFAEEGADAERLDTLTSSMLVEIRQLDVEDVTNVSVETPTEGTRAVDALAIGALLVRLVDSAALRSLISAVRRWVHRGAEGSRTVRIEIDGDVLELTGASQVDQEQMVALFVRRHGGT